jgi:hypothetical protein
MRNDLTANAAPIGSRRRRAVRSGLLALPLALALIAPGATAFAEPTTSYGQKTPPPATTTQATTTPATTTQATTTPSPKGEAAPTHTSSTTGKETPTSGTEPSATTAAKAKTLPFTGLDLRWMILGGVLLVGMGMSIVVVHRGRSTNR